MFTIISRKHQIALESGLLALIGRGEHCEIQLDDPSASRVHCRLLARDGKVFLTDAGSRWGTLVNGIRVTECELVPGDQITVGETLLTLALAGDAHGTTLARRSELLRPPGLTLARSTLCVSTASDEAEDDKPSERERKLQTKSYTASQPREALRSPAEYLSKQFAGTHIQEFLCRTRSGLLFQGERQGQPVAIKLLHPGCLRDKVAHARFLRAVALTRGLKHPSLVALLAGGIQDGTPFAVSEFVDGESAEEMIRRIGIAGMLDWRATLQIAIDVATALEYLEGQGVLHRNVTPQHILIRADNKRASLNDLLLAKALDDTQSTLTQAGELVGDAAYVSPEQLGSGQPVDHRSDLYQLGATLYALLTGRPPFEERNAANVITAVLRDHPTPPTRYHLAIPPLFEGTVMTLLSKRPQDRFPSANALFTALQRVQKYSG